MKNPEKTKVKLSEKNVYLMCKKKRLPLIDYHY